MKIFHPCKNCIVQFMCKNKCDNLENYMKIFENDNFFNGCVAGAAIIYWIVFMYISITINWLWILIPAIISIGFTIFAMTQSIEKEPSWESVVVGLLLPSGLAILGLWNFLDWYYKKYVPEELN